MNTHALFQTTQAHTVVNRDTQIISDIKPRYWTPFLLFQRSKSKTISKRKLTFLYSLLWYRDNTLSSPLSIKHAAISGSKRHLSFRNWHQYSWPQAPFVIATLSVASYCWTTWNHSGCLRQVSDSKWFPELWTCCSIWFWSIYSSVLMLIWLNWIKSLCSSQSETGL